MRSSGGGGAGRGSPTKRRTASEAADESVPASQYAFSVTLVDCATASAGPLKVTANNAGVGAGLVAGGVGAVAGINCTDGVPPPTGYVASSAKPTSGAVAVMRSSVSGGHPGGSCVSVGTGTCTSSEPAALPTAESAGGV